MSIRQVRKPASKAGECQGCGDGGTVTVFTFSGAAQLGNWETRICDHCLAAMGVPVREHPHLVMYQGTGQWSALYVDGQLAKYGDHDYVHEHLFKILNQGL